MAPVFNASSFASFRRLHVGGSLLAVRSRRCFLRFCVFLLAFNHSDAAAAAAIELQHAQKPPLDCAKGPPPHSPLPQ